MIVGCGQGGSGPDDDAHPGAEIAINHTNHGCLGTDDALGTPLDPEAFLVGFAYDGNTLTLKIRFVANCCPQFVTKAWAEANHIEIEVVDILAGCKCICPYENDFGFPWTSSGQVEIAFLSRPLLEHAYPCSLDTVIVLPEWEQRH
jgi:hypothetical protein